MPNILHRIGTEKVTMEKMYEAVSSVNGLKAWWTPNIVGESKVGSIIQFRFSKGGPDFEVITLDAPKTVEWRCIQGPAEWIDTHIEFHISNEAGETILLFKHSGWREEVDFMNHCTTQWGVFLAGLRQYLETGTGTPYGKGLEVISRWSK